MVRVAAMVDSVRIWIMLSWADPSDVSIRVSPSHNFWQARLFRYDLRRAICFVQDSRTTRLSWLLSGCSGRRGLAKQERPKFAMLAWAAVSVMEQLFHCHLRWQADLQLVPWEDRLICLLLFSSKLQMIFLYLSLANTSLEVR